MNIDATIDTPGATRENVAALVHAFYRDVRADALLGPLFEHAIPGDWEPHLARMVEFWCTVLLGTRSFRGDVLHKHVALKALIRGEHFSRWLTLWRHHLPRHLPAALADEALAAAVGIGRNLHLGCIGAFPRVETDETGIRFLPA